MKLDDSITAYADLLQVMHKIALNHLPNEALDRAVEEIVSLYGGSSTELFCSATKQECKVFVVVETMTRE